MKEVPASVHRVVLLFSVVCCGVCLIGCDSPSDANRDPLREKGSAGARASVDEHVIKRDQKSDLVDRAVQAPDGSTAGIEERVDQADQLVASGDLNRASVILTSLLIATPDDVNILFRLANVKASQGDFAGGIELLASIPEDDPVAGLPALGQSADWCFQARQYTRAEEKYARLIELAPNASRAIRQLALLYNRQGRRHEAAELVRQLCRLGDVRQEELHSLIVLSDAMADADDGRSGQQDYAPIGASGEARLLFTQKRYSEAAEALRESVQQGDAPPSIVALYGRALAEAQDEDAFLQWIPFADDSVRSFAEYWAAMTVYLASHQQPEAAIRAALEALDRDPTDFLTINRLSHMLRVLGRTDQFERWEERWNALNKVLLANNSVSDSQPPDVQAIEDLSSQLFAIDRKLEAVLWKSLAVYYRKLPAEALKHWNVERQRLVAEGEDFPGRETRLCGMKIDAFPLPNLKFADVRPTRRSDNQASLDLHPQPAAFRNVAVEIGLEHAYRVSNGDQRSGFAMYQQTGGGIAVLDYDQDGWPDFYFAQGAAEAPEFVADASDVLYRSFGDRVVDVTEAAALTEHRYTIGCSAGDWNQDGMPDLITASVGWSALLINNGDGTFSHQPLPGNDDLERMPASIAIADLNGDALPDLFELNYIQDPRIGVLPPRDPSGVVMEAVGPGDFSPAMDRIGINDGTGQARFRPISESPAEAYPGLGVIIADFDGNPGNEVFVGNDKSPNQMWVRDPASAVWSDGAVAKGNAYSSGGGATASMGIAAGDFDNNGSLDLHITNFQNESVCLYLNDDGFFRDRAIEYKLGVPSRSVLGFGSQTLDYDNNGLPDLVVSNGHIDQYRSMSGPYQQSPQLFCNLGDRFQAVEVADSSGYWDSTHLGRGLSRIDFNRDGKNDFLISHVGETSALMLNESPSENHWLQLRLVGVESERDAVGTRITIQFAGRESTAWVIGGDGYLARNESIVSFGLGNADVVDQVVVQWPSGVRQQFENLSADQRVLLLENQSDPYRYETTKP